MIHPDWSTWRRYHDLQQEAHAMALKPRPKPKGQQGIPIGNFDVVRDAAGKSVIKPKKKHRTLQQDYASKNRKTWRGAK